MRDGVAAELALCGSRGKPAGLGVRRHETNPR